MTLIKSISGIRGIIGGAPDNGLTPEDIIKYTRAYAEVVLAESSSKTIVIGRDGRMSGPMVHSLVVGTLLADGVNVVDLGLSTTPTVEMAVTHHNAAGGIILTASHNPKQWNALKLLNAKGEFISAAQGQEVLDKGKNLLTRAVYNDIDNIGKHTIDTTSTAHHMDAILKHPLVDKAAVEGKKFKVVVDAINSTGAIYVPMLLNALGVHDVTVLNAEVSGDFAHNPEPLPEHLKQLCDAVVAQRAHLGIAVDPDVDRLCFVNEDGTLFGEEYTLVAVADYILSKTKGNTVSNMSSTRALRDVTVKHGGEYFASAVGEVNVVTKMKEVNAVIGGEGNGGIIDPQLHYGRDALVGIALFLTHLAHTNLSMTALRATYPAYFMSKNKIDLPSKDAVANIFEKLKQQFANEQWSDIDGLKIDFADSWAHIRTSNTEPIMRIYTEAPTEAQASDLAQQMVQHIQKAI
ncbi:MAG: phosphoglucosamine mutase [Bacteroidota bacterium]|jgi:phosphomannomutase